MRDEGLITYIVWIEIFDSISVRGLFSKSYYYYFLIVYLQVPVLHSFPLPK